MNQTEAVALKAYKRIAKAWNLSDYEAARLADMSEIEWERVKDGKFSGDLSEDQMMRLSAIVGIYKGLEIYFYLDRPFSREWVKIKNMGPEFLGARPIDAMIEGGLPMIMDVRRYVDAMAEGL